MLTEVVSVERLGNQGAPVVYLWELTGPQASSSPASLCICSLGVRSQWLLHALELPRG